MLKKINYQFTHVSRSMEMLEIESKKEKLRYLEEEFQKI